MKHVQLGIHAASHACGAGDEILCAGIGGDANCEAFAHSPIFAYILRFHVGLETAVDLFGDLAKRKFAQSDEIAAPKEILERALDFFVSVDVATLHAVLEGFGGEVHHDCFAGGEGNPVGNGFANLDTGDGADHGGDAFDVLNVQSGDDVDFGGENFLNVFIAFAVFAAGDVGVGEFVD